MIRNRQLEVLRAVVSNYVSTREPVSSKAVAVSSRLAVSSATIRNDMGVLEREGLIFQPHTSAGRVPTEAGYRLFVDKLTEMRPLTGPQRNAIEAFLGQAVDFEDVIARTVRLLAQLTRSAALVEYPAMGASTLRRVEVVELPPTWLLVVVVASTGQVEERRLDIAGGVGARLIEQMRNHLNGYCEGKDAKKIVAEEEQILAQFAPEDRHIVEQVVGTIAELLSTHAHSRIVVAGLSYLARSRQDFEDVSTVLDTLEEQVALLRLLSEVHTDPVQVSIGTENLAESLEETSVVSANYLDSEDWSSRVGVLGPTRMDYQQSLVAVEAVSRYLSKHLME